VFQSRPIFSTLLCLAAVASSAAAAPVDFNRDIRPILSENCFYCHGQDPNHRKADLRLDQRAGALEGKAFIPGDPDQSEIIKRLLSTDPDEVMPPPDSNRTVTEAQRAKLKQWIAEGAAYAEHWAYIPPVRPLLPAVTNHAWPRNQIDHFVLHQLESHSLAPSPEADKTTLLRRVTYDLTGLPPSPEEVNAFLADNSPVAYEKVVDRLMASPHYGERMAIPWLDAARYADSNGFQQDGDTFQWVWRDWVVKSLNNDMPFDQFATEQLAGDLLPNATLDQKIATAFNRNHLLNGEGGAIAEEQRNIILFDRVDVTSTTFLGLTVACAQCHDHKYDPITQKDYYSLMAAFNNIPESGVPKFYSSRIRVGPPVVELRTESYDAGLEVWKKKEAEVISSAGKDWSARRDALQKAWEDDILAKNRPEDNNWKGFILNVREAPKDKPNNYAAGRLRTEFESKHLPALPGHDDIKRVLKVQGERRTYESEELPRVMVMEETQPRETHLLSRGDYEQPLEKVSYAPPAFLPAAPAGSPANRLGLAQWLFSPSHPLTARVQVNRFWQLYFGTGLVKTSEDLGVQGEYPIHAELLDWLAVEFRERGWHPKALHRLIVTSATYRQSSRSTPELRQKDPENRLLSRGPRFRLPAMFLRDTALAASGLLQTKIGGKPVYPYQPEGIWDSLAITKERDFTYPLSTGPDLYRRSLYTFHRRTVGPANMFDASARQACKVRPDLTNTPLHSLTTLNDPTWVEAARVLAARLLEAPSDNTTRLTQAFRRILIRQPQLEDLRRMETLLERQRGYFTANPDKATAFLKTGASPPAAHLSAPEHAAWTALCLGLFNLDEALTRE
jgi:mono/diheme cytochrome c family protein